MIFQKNYFKKVTIISFQLHYWKNPKSTTHCFLISYIHDVGENYTDTDIRKYSVNYDMDSVDINCYYPQLYFRRHFQGLHSLEYRLMMEELGIPPEQWHSGRVDME